MKLVILGYVLLFAPLALLAAEPPEQQGTGPEPLPPQYDLRPLQAELGQVMHRHYPGVTSHTLDNQIYFERDTRIFLIHYALKTGKWQDPTQVRGPNPDGIVVEIAISPGEYLSQGQVPSTLDEHYFLRLVMAPYSKKLDAHLHVTVKHPRDASKDFLRELTAVADRFDQYVEKPKK